MDQVRYTNTKRKKNKPSFLNTATLVVYHKVACALYIFHIPLSEIDNEIIHKLSNSNKQQDNCVSIVNIHTSLLKPSSPSLIVYIYT